VTHEYPPNRAYDSVSVSRVSALRDYALTLRQREFLVAVMVHSGCFLERQYCEFTGTARGQNSREFVAACTMSTTNRFTKRLAKQTTATVVFARLAGWSSGL
jgi:hypothetical protein